MNIMKMFGEMTEYLTEAFTRIFAPNETDMPDIGIQPFDCEFYAVNSEAKG